MRAHPQTKYVDVGHEFGHSPNTVKNRFLGLVKPRRLAHEPYQKLRQSEEKAIEAHILKLDDQGQAPSGKLMREMGAFALRRRFSACEAHVGSHRPTRNWGRLPRIAVRRRRLERERKVAAIRKCVERYFNLTTSAEEFGILS